MATTYRYLAAILSMMTILGCSGEPEIVYVPGEGYQESIHVATEQGPDAAVDVGEPLTLHVTRRSGPWVEVKSATLGDDACRLVNPPDPHELEVADNVRWVADPAEGVAFDRDLSEDHTRTVTFDAKGQFALTATSASWCFEPFAGPPVMVQVGASNGILDHVEEESTVDLDGIIERGFLRILTVHSPLYFTFDGEKRQGLAVEMSRLFEEHLAKEIGRVKSPTVVMIPVARDELLPSLVAGRGDIAVANLTITPERKEEVAFSAPTYPGVNELVITGPAAPGIASFDDLAGTDLHLRPSSSYFEHMQTLNVERERQGKPPIPVKPADEYLEDHDLLDLVNAGVLPAIVVDSHKASFWAQVFPDIVVHDDLAIHTGANVGWAVRRNNPQLLKTVNSFVKMVRKGSLLGNMTLSRYLGSTDWVDREVAGSHSGRYEQLAQTFKKYASQYDFDWVMIAAQGYQESRFDQSKRSSAGAVGIMQLLPTTAADRVVGIPDILTEDANIHAGTKYLAWLRDHYFSDGNLEPLDRMLFSFAAYNAGPGNVARARRRTKSMGFDPDRWFGNVEVGMYRSVSGEPVSYVRNVYKYYVTYKRLDGLRRAQERAMEREQDG
jgi:membrane-bound lytic murein transglycosylase MltF